MTKTRYPLQAKRWQQEVPVLLAIESTSADGNRDDAVCKQAVLPFLPRPDDELGVGADGDFITVEQVFWCPAEGITVWFCREERRLDRLLADGWKPLTNTSCAEAA